MRLEKKKKKERTRRNKNLKTEFISGTMAIAQMVPRERVSWRRQDAAMTSQITVRSSRGEKPGKQIERAP